MPTRSARGNTSLESAVALTKSLRWEIQNLGQRLASAANARAANSGKKYQAQHELELKSCIQAMRKLLNRIEDAVPLINLAITASGASLSTNLPSTVSPSRLLQASTFLTAGDTQYSISPSASVQIGPTFTLSMYMLFMGHMRPQNEEDVRESTWKEVIHKAVVKLFRIPINRLHTIPGSPSSGDEASFSIKDDGSLHPSIETDAKADEYAYQLAIVEDLDDDRVHTFEDHETQPSAYDDIEMAGIREAIPIHEISKIFYADTGKILNIGTDGEVNNPVLLLKRDLNAVAPRRMMDRYGGAEEPLEEANNIHQTTDCCEDDAQRDNLDNRHDDTSIPLASQQSVSVPAPWALPPGLDPEWIALEVYTETPSSDSDESDEPDPALATKTTRPQISRPQSAVGAEVVSTALSQLRLRSSTPTPTRSSPPPIQPEHAVRPSLPPIRTSLSLLETLLRLLSLQQFQQAPHLSIPDELLTFFLSESASTGAAASDVQERKRLRSEARRRVGFDPYDESPVKRRGEDYQYQYGYNGGGEEYYSHQQYRDAEEYSNPNVTFRAPSAEEYEGFSPVEVPGPGPEYATPIRYSDEGYATRNMSFRRLSSPLSRSATTSPPQTPPFVLKNSRASGPSSKSPSISPMQQQRWMRTHHHRKDFGGAQSGKSGLRQGSPLASSVHVRSRTGTTDEGLGTSPSSSSSATATTAALKVMGTSQRDK